MKQPDQHVQRNRFIGFSYSEPLVYSSSTESLGISSPLTQSMHLGLSPASIMFPSIINEDLYEKLQQALEEAEKSRQETCAESERRQKAEKEALEAIFQVKEAEEELNKVKEDLKETKFELQKYSQMLIKVANKISSLKQTEHDNSVQLIGGSKKVAQEPSSSHFSNFSCEFSLLDLKEATKCFDTSLIIEKGEYGSVYKGFLYHTEVAIKILKPISLQVISEFKQEVNVLSKLRHPNLVTLVGACPDSLALIYEYLPNRSLGDRLSCNDNTPSLPWKTRIRILTELNSVLNFLHSIQPCSIIHSNLNLKNILLDANFCCNLTDFGSCHIIPKNRQIVTAEPKGNSPYMDPEFIETGHLSRKSDVYSFGIIALQLLTGRPALNIIEEVQHALENDNLDSILDPSAGDWPFVRAKQLAYMALKCCDAKGKNRPELGSEVLSVLKPLIYPHGRLVCGDQVPSYFICPIFQEIMRDPHFAADGFTYEADALKGWFEGGHDTSPMTNLKLNNHNLTPNRALRSTIQEWLLQHQHDL